MEKQKMNTERYISTGELMKLLSISRSTVYRLMDKGLPNIMVGTVHRFSVNQIVGWLEKQKRIKLNNRETLNDEV